MFTSRARAAGVLALCALASGTAWAGDTPAVPAADPHAPVPPLAYGPAISYQAVPAPDSTPDRAWVASNEAVTRKAPAAAMAAPDEHAAHAAHTGHAAMSVPPAAAAAGQCMAGGQSGCCCKDGCACCAGMGGGQQPGAAS